MELCPQVITARHPKASQSEDTHSRSRPFGKWPHTRLQDIHQCNWMARPHSGPYLGDQGSTLQHRVRKGTQTSRLLAPTLLMALPPHLAHNLTGAIADLQTSKAAQISHAQ